MSNRFGSSSLCVSVVAYNSGADLVRLIQAAAAASIDVSVHVTPNHTSDVQLLREIYLPSLSVGPYRGNIGFGAGHLSAYAALNDGEWLWCLNPDLLCSPETFENMARAVQAVVDPEVAILVPTIDGPDGRQEPITRNAPLGEKRLASLLELILPAFARFSQGQLSAPHGAAFAVRKVPGFIPFDSDNFLFFEELILGVRASSMGLRLQRCPDVILYHSTGVSRGGRMSAQMKRHLLDAQSHYLGQTMGWPRSYVRIARALSGLRMALKR